MTYSNPNAGPVNVLVSMLPSLPLDITVIGADKWASMELVGGDEANRIQVGPSREAGFDMLLRAVKQKSGIRETVKQILPGMTFSQTATVSGNSTVIQCGGSLSIGGSSRRDGGYLRLPLGSKVSVADAGEITIRHEGWICTIQEAVEMGLLEVEI